MLATILKTKKAINTSIAIMDAFILMRKKLIEYKDMLTSISNINNELEKHNEKINYILSKIDKKGFLYFPGQIFDAYTDIVSILKQASNEIIIINPYLDINILKVRKYGRVKLVFLN